MPARRLVQAFQQRFSPQPSADVLQGIAGPAAWRAASARPPVSVSPSAAARGGAGGGSRHASSTLHHSISAPEQYVRLLATQEEEEWEEEAAAEEARGGTPSPGSSGSLLPAPTLRGGVPDVEQQ